MSDTALLHALAFLRGHARGDLRFGEHVRGVRYVIALDGWLVMPVMVAMLSELDTVLFVPEMADGSMEVQLTLEPFEDAGADGALADRWRIHHGDPPDVRWARGCIDAVRLEEFVIDGESLMVPNPLAGAEPALCREMNTEHADALPAICRHGAGIGVDRPVVVSVDPAGVNLRGRFDVYRVPFPEAAPDAEAARAALQALVAEATGAAPRAVPAEEPVESTGERVSEGLLEQHDEDDDG